MTRVVVISPSRKVAAELALSLPSAEFRVLPVKPGPGVLRVLRRERPTVVVVDGIDGRPEAAQLEIELAKELCPETRVIALSGNSLPVDAWVVEQGVFYYMAAPGDGELVRVVRVAACHTEAAQRRG